MAKIIIITDPPDDGTGHRSAESSEPTASVKVEGLTNEQAQAIAEAAIQITGGSVEE